MGHPDCAVREWRAPGAIASGLVAGAVATGLLFATRLAGDGTAEILFALMRRL